MNNETLDNCEELAEAVSALNKRLTALQAFKFQEPVLPLSNSPHFEQKQLDRILKQFESEEAEFETYSKKINNQILLMKTAIVEAESIDQKIMQYELNNEDMNEKIITMLEQVSENDSKMKQIENRLNDPEYRFDSAQGIFVKADEQLEEEAHKRRKIKVKRRVNH